MLDSDQARSAVTAARASAFLRHHGGRLAAARDAFPGAVQPWLDLSTGVNPAGWRPSRPPAATLRLLPDPADTAALEAAAARAFGAEPSCVAAVPGAEAGLRLLPHVIGARTVAVVSPTYGSHADAWLAAGAEVRSIDRSAFATCDAEAVVLVNPNNPDGAMSSAADICASVDRAPSRWLIVDESFVDTVPEISVASHACGRLIVLRSFGKFYGLPGLRLGFVVADPAVIARVRSLTGDWPVGADAIAIGRAAYGDPQWPDAMRRRLARAAKRLDRLLVQHGFPVIGGTSLFRLTARTDARTCFQRLAEAGILVRPFADRPAWLRFGLPPAGGWDRLAAALQRCGS